VAERTKSQGRPGDSSGVGHLEKHDARLRKKLAKASEPTTRAELDQERRQVNSEWLLTRLKEAHRQGRI
jgi:hypothetical protein